MVSSLLLWSDQEHVRLRMACYSSFYIELSTAVPTRLFALKHGADLVWGPEIVDKAILHADRVVDRELVFISLDFFHSSAVS
jgi:hypothetical protein